MVSQPALLQPPCDSLKRKLRGNAIAWNLYLKMIFVVHRKKACW
jgi:hypothetical protein